MAVLGRLTYDGAPGCSVGSLHEKAPAGIVSMFSRMDCEPLRRRHNLTNETSTVAVQVKDKHTLAGSRKLGPETLNHARCSLMQRADQAAGEQPKR
jgi:hypothetical protein